MKRHQKRTYKADLEGVGVGVGVGVVVGTLEGVLPRHEESLLSPTVTYSRGDVIQSYTAAYGKTYNSTPGFLSRGIFEGKYDLGPSFKVHRERCR